MKRQPRLLQHWLVLLTVSTTVIAPHATATNQRPIPTESNDSAPRAVEPDPTLGGAAPTTAEEPTSPSSQQRAKLNSRLSRPRAVTSINMPHLSDEAYRVILDPRRSTVISAEVMGRVQEIPKKLGDSFSKGETLVRLDDARYKARFDRAYAQKERSLVKFETQKLLWPDGIASKLEYVEAEAEVAIAQAELDEARTELESCTIEAPYDGKMVFASIEEYELANVGDPLIEIVDDKILIAKLLAFSSDLNKLQVGNPLVIDIDGVGPRETTITRLGAVIDPASSTIEVEAEIDNRDGSLKAGMTGLARL